MYACASLCLQRMCELYWPCKSTGAAQAAQGEAAAAAAVPEAAVPEAAAAQAQPAVAMRCRCHHRPASLRPPLPALLQRRLQSFPAPSCRKTCLQLLSRLLRANLLSLLRMAILRSLALRESPSF